MQRAVFFDRDGTLIVEKNYLSKPEEIEVLPGVFPALRKLLKKGFNLFVISNQSGIARGYFTQETIDKIHEKMISIFKKEKITFSGIYYCPHLPGGLVKKFAILCSCRKPLPGLIIQAKDENCIDLKSSYVVGDQLRDIKAGNLVGAKTILLSNRGIHIDEFDFMSKPDFIASSMTDVVEWILLKEEK